MTANDDFISREEAARQAQQAFERGQRAEADLAKLKAAKPPTWEDKVKKAGEKVKGFLSRSVDAVVTFVIGYYVASPDKEAVLNKASAYLGVVAIVVLVILAYVNLKGKK